MGPVSKSDRLDRYVLLIEEFLERRKNVDEFTGEYFRAFQLDPGSWEGDLYEALNWVAMACEGYSPGAPKSEFDVTEEQLRVECSERLAEIQVLRSSVKAEDLKNRLGLLSMAAGGTLDGLPCPSCATATVSVRFTVPAPGEYRTWFLCSNCDFRMRAQNSGKPTHFDAARVDLDLEREDRA